MDALTQALVDLANSVHQSAEDLAKVASTKPEWETVVALKAAARYLLSAAGWADQGFATVPDV